MSTRQLGLWAVVVLAAGGMAVAFLRKPSTGTASAPTPAVEPSPVPPQDLTTVLGEEHRLPSGFPAPRPRVPVSQDGGKLKVGSLSVDLANPSQALRDLIMGLREAHRAWRQNKRDPRALTSLREQYAAISELIRRFPELGLQLYHDILTEPDAEVGLALSRLLKVSSSPELVRTLTGVLEAGAPPAQQIVALRGLEGRPEPEPSRSILAAWNRETDPALRTEFVRTLSVNLSRSLQDDAARTDLMTALRTSARTTADPARRVEAVRALVDGQRGTVDEEDRTLIQQLFDRETDTETKAALLRLKDRVPATLRGMDSNP